MNKFFKNIKGLYESKGGEIELALQDFVDMDLPIYYIDDSKTHEMYMNYIIENDLSFELIGEHACITDEITVTLFDEQRYNQINLVDVLDYWGMNLEARALESWDFEDFLSSLSCERDITKDDILCLLLDGDGLYKASYKEMRKRFKNLIHSINKIKRAYKYLDELIEDQDSL